MEWHYKGFPTPKRFKTQPSAGKIMAVSLGFRGGDFMLISCHGVQQLMLCNAVHQVTHKKRLGKLSHKITALHDNVHTHMANLK
jgi:hypothetical protein